MGKNKILAINPGSTSTKIAVYDGIEMVYSKNIKHDISELSQFNDIIDQFQFRKDLILKTLKEENIDISSIKIIVGRGGLLRPIQSGIYNVNDTMKEDLVKGAQSSQHASNLGGLIADDLANSIKGASAFIADPPVVDELDDLARITGHPEFQRKSIFHALNHKAVARKHARSISKKYDDLNLIVVHLGGGISIGAHKKGKIIDVNNALDGEGPFSPERSGSLPVGDVVKLCFSGKYSLDEIKTILVGKGGVSAHLNTNDIMEVENRISNGDSKAKLIYDAMIYQVAKYVGSMYAALSCEVDEIIITGGIAHSKYFTDELISRIGKIAPVVIYPGEDEMEALAMNGWMVLNGEIDPLEY